MRKTSTHLIRLILGSLGGTRLQPCHKSHLKQRALAPEDQHPVARCNFSRFYETAPGSQLRFASHAGLFGLLLLLPLTASAQLRVRPEQVVTPRVVPAHIEVERQKGQKGKTATVTLVASILEGYHINSTKPLEDYLIPSRVELDSEEFELIEAKFPAGELKSFSFSEEKLSVYEGTLRIPLRLRAKKDTAPGSYTARIVFHYQACNDRICLRPTKRTATLSVQLR